MTIVVLVPTVVFVLTLQHTAPTRLARLGIRPHPQLGTTVGVAAGIGSHPAWVFRTEVPAVMVADYYRADSTHPGWRVVESSPMGVVLQRDSALVSILASGDPPDVRVAVQWLGGKLR